MSVLEELGKIGIIPVVVIHDIKDAVPLADALCHGGLPCAEVTFRTECAADAIAAMRKSHPEMLIGAGTVLSPEQADCAIDAGASVIISPGIFEPTVRRAKERGVAVCPGVVTASELNRALSLELDHVKFFPAESAGGLKTIKALAAPYPMMKFMPTGGLNIDNVAGYLAYDHVFCCGGSWMVAGELIREGRFDEIETLASAAAGIVKAVRG